MKPAAFLILLALAFPADARDRNQVWKFRKANPCPSTQRVKGPCPGWQVDHVEALRCGGPDTVANLQWLRIAEHKKKSAHEARTCKKPRK